MNQNGNYFKFLINNDSRHFKKKIEIIIMLLLLDLKNEI